jgi:hypothetical protein
MKNKPKRKINPQKNQKRRKTKKERRKIILFNRAMRIIRIMTNKVLKKNVTLKYK